MRFLFHTIFGEKRISKMPAMVAFGRRWAAGTDDLLLMGLTDIVLYLPGVIWIVYEIYHWFDSYRSHCSTPLLIDFFVVAFFCFIFTHWLLSICFIFFCSKGAIFQTEARKRVVPLFYIKAIACALDIGLASLGTYMLHESDFCNSSKALFVVKLCTIFLWIVTAFRSLYALIIYDTKGRQKAVERKEPISREHFSTSVATSSIQQWKLRFHALFFWCAAFSNAKKDAINTMSELFAFVFQGLDLVPSDVVAGIMLFNQICQKKYESEKLSLDSAPAIIQSDGTAVDCFPTTDMESWMNLNLAQRYFHLGLGVFGWPWVIYRNVSCGLCSMWNKMKCCFSFRRDSFIEGDNCCGCHTAGLLVTSDVPYEDLVQVSFQNGVYVIPFFVAVDPETSVVIITTRGTMSFTDVITDLAAGISHMPDANCPPDTFCHSGMLKAAQKIKEKLDEGILSAAFSGHESYRLITTGHSLGAGVACLLALLLRPTYPSVRCYAFAPPPTISINGLSTTFSCIFTVIFGNDIVPFLSLRNVQFMTHEIMQHLKECNLPKHKIFLGCPPESQSSNCLPSDQSENDTLNSHESKFSSGEISGDMNPNPINHSKEEVIDEEDKEENILENGSQVLTSPPQKTDLYVPGKILHIRKSENGYRLHMALAQDFHPLRFRPQMCAHHFPQHMEKCLKELGETYTVLAVSL